ARKADRTVAIHRAIIAQPFRRSTFLAGLGALTAARASAAASTPLAIGTSSDPNNGALVIIATRMNYFAENGLDVSIKYFPSAGDLVSAMAAGALKIGAGGTVPTTTLRAGGFPVVLLAQQADISNVQEIVAAKGIIEPKDFIGKKIGALSGTISEMLATTMLNRFHVPSDKVTLVNLGPADMVTALIRGDIVGAALWEPWCSQAVKGGAHRMLSGSQSYIPGQTGPIDLIGDHGVLVAAKPWVDANPQIVSAVLKAQVRALHLIATNPDKAAEVVGAELKVPAADMKTFMARDRYSLTIDAKLIRDMSVETSFLQGHGKLKTPIKPSDWVDTGPLRAVSSKLVTWNG
ncbi:MAG: ABC transporter substrate-binding protein, partial [Vulcanimicrobiaceae bacterium]